MEKIVIFNANNESMNVEVVRYFADGNNKYFVFSLHEVDAQNHMNIYVTKIVDQNGALIGTNIIDDVEWTNLKTNLQRIIKDNRTNGNAIVNDLPFNTLSNVKVLDRRALKLLATSVEMLNLGYIGQSSEENNVPIVNEVNNIEEPITNNNQVNEIQPPVQNDMNIFNQSVQTVEPVNVQPVSNESFVQPQTNVQPDFNIVQPNINVTPVQNVASNQEQVNNSETNYQQLYLQEKENSNRLAEENNRLNEELNSYRELVSALKNVLSK